MGRIFTNVGWIDSILKTRPVLKALGVGAYSGLASTGVQNLIRNGLYHRKGGRVCQSESDGKGLYLGPTSGRGFETAVNGLTR